ncbi:hypothetical protein PHLGIDRAFT_121770 [Phlebiopsis gigantea 11061_1 CR5-6]|uniref:BTB domain-containing protein n=1 Tax=Phlebiopsis gigantea (strain 11061_1 CR5-6) TaxID=745531 RepID=A0A0C3RSC5_PHLG1|nr:hypothetical protein PHLGIDRAFT_121770 [Phlebiopsis gigantea 11061_1 CR5-6]
MDQDANALGGGEHSREGQDDGDDSHVEDGGDVSDEAKEAAGGVQETESGVKEERYSSLEYEEPPVAQKNKLFARSSSGSESEDIGELFAVPTVEENLRERTESLPLGGRSPVVEPVTIPSEEPMDDVPGDATEELERSRENTRELSAEPSSPDGDNDESRNEPAAQSKPGPRDVSPVNASLPAKTAVEAPASSSSSSPSPTPDAKIAPFFDLVRPRRLQPKPKMRMPPATQPAPDTGHRPFAAAAAQNQTPRVASKRKNFLHIPASQPSMAVTAPVRQSAGSSTAVSQRAMTIDSEESGSEGRRRKRAKMSGSSVATFKVPLAQPKPFRRPEKHPDHWHTDGSVILTFGHVAFRLHRSRLSQQSTFFAELFHGGAEVVRGSKDELAVKAWREGNMDGKPLFVVEGVSPDDFDQMLKAADNAITFVFQPPSFAELASILRASLSLSFTSLSSFATHQLTTMWPGTLPSHHTPIPGQRADAEETIVLARTCALPALLKRALYELLRAPGLGQRLDDEFMLAGDDAAWARRKVSRTDLARAAAAEHWRELVLNSDLYVEYMNDPLEGLERLAELRWEEKGFCGGCVASWRTSWMRQREKIWANLDLWLELPQEEGRESDTAV